MILEGYRNAARVANNYGEVPLHLACAHQASRKVIELLLETNRTTAYRTNDDGGLPLHLACSNQASKDVIESLLEEYHWLAENENYTRDLPLHLACANQASKTVIQLLLEADVLNPARNNQGLKVNAQRFSLQRYWAGENEEDDEAAGNEVPPKLHRSGHAHIQ